MARLGPRRRRSTVAHLRGRKAILVAGHDGSVEAVLRVGVAQAVERGVGIGTVACLVRECGRWDLLPLGGIGDLACKAVRSGTEGGERAATGRWPS